MSNLRALLQEAHARLIIMIDPTEAEADEDLALVNRIDAAIEREGGA